MWKELLTRSGVYILQNLLNHKLTPAWSMVTFVHKLCIYGGGISLLFKYPQIKHIIGISFHNHFFYLFVQLLKNINNY